MSAKRIRTALKAMPHWLPVTLAAALLLLLAGGLWFYCFQSQVMQREVETNLTAIAQLKTEQIAAWRRDQLNDAEVVVPSVYTEAVQFLAGPDEANEQSLRTVLQSLAAQHDYIDILLVDRAGAERWSLTDNEEHYREYLPALETALQTGEPVFVDLHRDLEKRFAHVSVVVPLSNGAESPGALVLINDAAQFLYPLIQSWPTPSQSAETLLVRREGDQVLFLNDLRHQPGTALELRLPLSQADLPAVMAVQGVEGFVLGNDYRGAAVAAVLLPVPDSPWYMVAKMDADEAFSEWHFRSTIILITMLSGMALSVAGGVAVQQRREKARYRALHRAQADQKALLEAVYRNAPLVMMVVDEERRVRQVNGFATQFAGRSAEDMLGLRGGKALRCLHALDSPEGCGFGPFCQQCVVRNTVLDTLANGATHQQVEASLPFEIAGKEEQRTFLLSATPLGLADEPLALVTMLDITQRVRAQQKLQESSERWQRTFGAMRDGIALLDSEHRILQYNRAFAEIYEDGGGRLAGRFCYGVVHGTDCPIKGCPFVRAKTTYQRENMQMKINDRTYNIIVDPILDERGELSGAVHIMTDITDLVQAEGRAQRLLAQQVAVNQLSAALGEKHDLSSIYVAIYDHVRELVDADAFIVSAYDSRAKQIRAAYAVNRGEVIAAGDLPPIPLEPPGQGTQSRVIHSGQPFYAPDFRQAVASAGSQYKIADDGTVSAGIPRPENEDDDWEDSTQSAVYVPMKVQGEVIGVMQAQSNRPDAYSQEDIELLSGMANVAAVAVQNARLIAQLEETVAERTAALEEKVEKLTRSERAMLYMVEDLNQITADLKTERRKLEISNQELEAFAYSVSHDLRAPLRAIDGYAGFLAQDYAGELDAEGQRFIDVIQQSAAKMDRLISDLLNLSRVSRAEMSRVSVDMVQVARSIYHEVASEPEQAAFEVEIQPLPPADCDPALIKQVWKNLIENALKYSANAAAKQITIGSQEGDGETVYWIKDCGAGFDPQYKHKLFGVFQRLHSEEQYGGSGVGLAIVQRIIRRHGGRVWAEGQPGQGATFYFALPVE